MKKHVYFVRHGESESNVGGPEGVAYGSAAQLTEKGKEQAERVATRIKNIGVDALISTSYPRALHTAEIIATRINLPIQQEDVFVETDRPTIAYGKKYGDPEIVALATKIFEGYSLPNFRHSDEENIDDLKKRSREALALLEHHPKEKICVVTHGRFLRVLFCAMLTDNNFSGLDLQRAIKTLSLHNTGVTYARFEEPQFNYEKGTTHTLGVWSLGTTLPIWGKV